MGSNGHTLVKGTGVLSTVRWIPDVYGDTVFRTMLDRVSKETAKIM